MKHSVDCASRLLAAARLLFARRGYHATSVRAITARAKANLGAITYHYGSKAALYHAVLASLVEPMGERVSLAAQAQGAPLDRVETIVRAFFEHVRRNPDMPAFMLREMATARAIPAPVARTMQRALGALSAVIVAGQRDATIRSGEPLLLALSVVAQPVYLSLARRALRDAVGLDQQKAAVADRVADHAVEMVRASLANPAKGHR